MDVPVEHITLTPPRSREQVLRQAYAVARHLGLKPQESTENRVEGRTDHYVNLCRGLFTKRTTVTLHFYYGDDENVKTLWVEPNINLRPHDDQALKDFRDYRTSWNDFCMDPNCKKRHSS